MINIMSRLFLHPQTFLDPLVLASSGLASLELLEIPVADLHVAAVVIHALGEVLGSAGAVVELLVLLGSGLGLDRCSL